MLAACAPRALEGGDRGRVVLLLQKAAEGFFGIRWRGIDATLLAMGNPIWHLVQLNIARSLAPLDSPQLADFVNQLDVINALAEASPGFVWRLTGDSGNATDVRVDDQPGLIVNMSVWTSAESLFDFVYRSMHTKVMARRREWFERIETFQVLYWIPAGQLPSVAEALARLELLRERGPSPEAFTFKRRFPTPGAPGAPINMRPEPYCVM